jgi:hypothetical protein
MFTEKDLTALAEALENCSLPPDQFHHAEHLAVASYFAATLPPRQALERLRIALRRYAAFQGKADRYHETITRFWLALVYTHQADSPAALANQVVAACAAMNRIERHYSKARIRSAEARAGWIAPDLEPLPVAAAAILEGFDQGV